MGNSQTARLALALEATENLLHKHGDRHTASRLEALRRRLELDETGAIITAISEATGGMGSLRDRYLCVENGDAIRPDEAESVNEQLGDLVRQVETSARAAAVALDIPLLR